MVERRELSSTFIPTSASTSEVRTQRAVIQDLRAISSTRCLVNNFRWMAVCFSINHGCVTCALALASSEFQQLGSYSCGTLYICYTVSALLASAPLVHIAGHKKALVGSLAMYSCYVFAFCLALIFPSIQMPVVIMGSVVGGLAAGVVWSAQGAFFALAVEHYARMESTTPKYASSFLSSTFAVLFLVFEVAIKLLQFAIMNFWQNQDESKLIVYATLSVVALTASAAMTLVWPMPRLTGDVEQPESGVKQIPSVLRLHGTDLKIWLLAPTNMAFGFTGAFVMYHVNAHYTTSMLGEQGIGLLTAIIPLVGAAIAKPIGWVNARHGKSPAMIVGLIAFAGIPTIFRFHEQSSGIIALVSIYCLMGIGRVVWEGTNRGLFADYFRDRSLAAFASLIVQNGLSAGFAFFLFPSLTEQTMALCSFGSAIMGIVGFVLARMLHQRQSSDLLLKVEGSAGAGGSLREV